MDSASIPSLTPLLDGIDRWAELAPLLPVLIALEIVLSADNAVALAAITRGLKSQELQRQALNVGIAIALILRVILILTAQYVLKYWPIQLMAGMYLLFLFLARIREVLASNSGENKSIESSRIAKSFLSTVILLSLTDLAFSIDSVAAAVAISDQYLLVITGAIIGVLSLRFTSGLFIRWLSIFTHLETAGYLAVGFVGAKLILILSIPNLILPQWIVLTIIGCIFVWGFSEKEKEIAK